MSSATVTTIEKAGPATRRRGGSARGPRIGTIVAVDDGSTLVDYDDNAGGPLVARSTVAIARSDAGREVLMIFERNNPALPVIVGFLADQPAPAIATTRGVDDVAVDGERIVFEATKEILLRCGEGSILMRSDGTVIIKGINITTRARALNKVRGAAVKIN